MRGTSTALPAIAAREFSTTSSFTKNATESCQDKLAACSLQSQITLGTPISRTFAMPLASRVRLSRELRSPFSKWPPVPTRDRRFSFHEGDRTLTSDKNEFAAHMEREDPSTSAKCRDVKVTAALPGVYPLFMQISEKTEPRIIWPV